MTKSYIDILWFQQIMLSKIYFIILSYGFKGFYQVKEMLNELNKRNCNINLISLLTIPSIPSPAAD